MNYIIITIIYFLNINLIIYFIISYYYFCFNYDSFLC